MTIEQLGSTGEFVAAIATIVTLIYLSIQIRANTKVAKAESRRTTTAQAGEFSALIADSSELASILLRGLASMDSLSPEDRVRFNFLFSMLVSQTQSTFEDYELGIVDLQTFETVCSPVFNMLSAPGGFQWWQDWGKGYLPQFRDHGDKILGGR